MSSIGGYMAIVARADAQAASDPKQMYAREDALPLPSVPQRRRSTLGLGRLRRLIGLSAA